MEAWRRIEDVFGWAPGSDKGKAWKLESIPERAKDDNARVGSIVFHDAWPDTWPKLLVDIVNNHHPDYYQAAPDDNDHPPGDWENPVPVYFLAVKSGTTFSFPLSKRRGQVGNDLLNDARDWLLGALCHFGAGAKTASGYGAFKPTNDGPPVLSSKKHATFRATLELVTPAFLAGAGRGQEDCIRTATLRGQLRWWWRTLHAGFLTVAELRLLEAAIWGDTCSGSAVRITLSPLNTLSSVRYAHPAERQSGTRYVAYGMDETSRGERRQRFVAMPGALWDLRVIARKTTYQSQLGSELTAEQVSQQVLAAFSLLTRFGGIGSKGRKGFGSLKASNLDLPDLAGCCSTGSSLREQVGGQRVFSVDRAESPSISDPQLQLLEILISEPHTQNLIELIGKAYSAVASHFKHDPDKAAWGLPRKIHGPMDRPLRHQAAETHRPPQWLDFPKRPRDVSPANSRHAAPIHLHVEPRDPGRFIVRLVGIPAKYLRDRDMSVRMLRAFAEAFKQEFDRLAMPQRPAGGPPTAARSASTPNVQLVEVTILERLENSGPNAFRVQEEGRPRGMVVHGTPPNPLPGIGDKVHVYREASTNPRSPMYRWSPPDSLPPKRNTGGKQPPRGGRR